MLAAKQMGAERIIVMSRHTTRQKLAREFGATDIVTERGDEGVATIKELTDGLGAHSVIEAVGTQESMMQAIRSTRPGGHVGFVGVAHGVELPGEELFFAEVHLHGGPAPVRRYLPELIDLVWNRKIDPGKVFDLTLPLDAGGRGLPRDGRAPRHQDAAAPVTRLIEGGCLVARRTVQDRGDGRPAHLPSFAPPVLNGPTLELVAGYIVDVTTRSEWAGAATDQLRACVRLVGHAASKLRMAVCGRIGGESDCSSDGKSE